MEDTCQAGAVEGRMKLTKNSHDGLRWFKLKKMSKCQKAVKLSIRCQKEVKLSKRCQMSKKQTHGLWRRFTHTQKK